MSSPRASFWLPVIGLQAPVALALGWLLLGFAADRTGSVALPVTAVDFLLEGERRLTVTEVTQRPATAWQAVASTQLLASARREAIWVRVTLQNTTARPLRGVLSDDYRFNDRVERWVEEDGGWAVARAGERVPAAEKAIAGRDVAFPVEVPAHGPRVVYLRAEDFFRAYLMLVWWPEAETYHAAKARGWLAEGVYFGGLLALLGYNALLWLRLRQPDIGYYVRYLAAIAAFFALVRSLVPLSDGVFASPAVEAALTVAVAASAFFLVRFTRTFLELEARKSRADDVARALSIMLVVLALGALLTPWLSRPLALSCAVVASGFVHALLAVIAVRAWRAGLWQARIFVVSFGFLIASTLVGSVAWLRASGTETAVKVTMIGSMLEMLLLSLAVAERVSRAQRQLLEETEQRRAIEEAYAGDLAEEVRERTHELEEANADKDRMLAVVGHDLRGPLTGLMRAADEAPGPFARDAARTGRALLLMIEDLVLWARLRAGTRALAPHPARAVLAPAVALHASLAEQGGTALMLEVPEELTVETDLVLAQTLVRNLVANALKFARTRVVLRAAADPAGGVRFTVGNDGPALSAEVAARLASDEDGPMTATSGLGLRLCREICRALGLRLEARAAPAGGTEFGFSLKAAPTTAAVLP
jgi:signal transduction histidine kinase